MGRDRRGPFQPTRTGSAQKLALVRGEASPGNANGFGRSKLTNQYFDSKLATKSTVRNWKTVLKLAEMSSTDPP
jgi:hypothetical protein